MKILCLPLLLVAALASASAPATSPARSPDQQVAELLGLTPGDGDFLPELAEVIKGFAKGDESHLPRLVTALLRSGGEKFRRALPAMATMDYDSTGQNNTPQWPYGRYVDRLKLRQYLWLKAKMLAGSDKERARDYARATLYFAAMDDFTLQPGAALAAFVPAKGAEADFVARGLEAKQAAALRALVIKWEQAAAPADERSLASVRAVDRLFKHPEETGQALAALQREFAAGFDRPIRQWYFTHTAWMLRSHAAAAKNDAAIKKIDAQIKTWRKDAPADLARWLDLAAASTTKPYRMHGDYIEVNGKMVRADD